MTRKLNRFQHPLLAALACTPFVFIAGCGGGGGDGGTSPTTSVSAIVITNANAKPVSADALANSTNTTAAQGGTSLVTGAQVGTSAGAASALDIAALARALAAKAPALPALATGAQTTQTLQCSFGGSMTITANLASSNGLSMGDTMSVTASSCSENIGGTPETISGKLTITVVSGGMSSTSTYPVRIGMRVDSTALSLVKGGVTTVSDGDVTVDMNQSSADVGTYTVTGTSLANTVTSAAGSRSFKLKAYSQTLVDNAGAMSYSVTATIETTNSRLGGTWSYSVSTPTNLTTDFSGAYTGGSLKVTGSGSALLLTVTGSNQFQIQVDTNGDGTYENTTSATRSELDGLL